MREKQPEDRQRYAQCPPSQSACIKRRLHAHIAPERPRPQRTPRRPPRTPPLSRRSLRLHKPRPCDQLRTHHQPPLHAQPALTASALTRTASSFHVCTRCMPRRYLPRQVIAAPRTCRMLTHMHKIPPASNHPTQRLSPRQSGMKICYFAAFCTRSIHATTSARGSSRARPSNVTTANVAPSTYSGSS